MENSNTYMEKLIRYLDDELSASEAEALREEFKSNSAMQQEMDNLILAKNVINSYGVTQKVNGIHLQMMEEMKEPKLAAKPIVRSLPKMIMRIAASLIILTGLFGLYQYITVSPDKLYNDQYVTYQTGKMRGAPGVNALEKAYGENKYDQVIAIYGNLAEPAGYEQFLAAQAYLNKADHANAISLLKVLLEKNKNAGTASLQDECEYYLALSYLKSKETAKALPLFQKIHDNKEHLYHSKISTWYLAKVKMLNWKN